MALTLRTVGAGLIGWTLISACPQPQNKDSEVRTYIRDELRPYLDSLAYQLCHVKAAAAPNVPGRIICPGPPDGYKPPPADGNP